VDEQWARLSGTVKVDLAIHKWENTMQRFFSAILALSFAFGSAAQADSRDGEKKEIRDELPRSAEVKWVVHVLEDAPSFAVVKREVKGNKVTWILENKRNLGTEITFGYQATLLDEDGVKIGTIDIEVEPFLMNLPKGERNRFVLHLPQPEKWKGVRKVVITNGLYNGD
jgi:hypothetical protein